jgi:hypothetical protein
VLSVGMGVTSSARKKQQGTGASKVNNTAAGACLFLHADQCLHCIALPAAVRARRLGLQCMCNCCQVTTNDM